VKPTAIFIRDKKLLINRTKGVSTFYAVGGKLEAGESDIECLQREVKEEIGCEVLTQKAYKTFIGPSSNGLHTMVMICFFVELSGEPTPSSEIEELKWVDSSTPKELLGTMISEYIIPALRDDELIN